MHCLGMFRNIWVAIGPPVTGGWNLVRHTGRVRLRRWCLCQRTRRYDLECQPCAVLGGDGLLLWWLLGATRLLYQLLDRPVWLLAGMQRLLG
jgi:hypothetical protein